ncbi:MAG: hypothetical protein J6I49_05280 [Bacteroidales bacterium]|nr:hypothetical protein [Bacteroidales bacterium]
MRQAFLLVFMAVGLLASAQSSFYRNYSTRREVETAVYIKNHRIDGVKVDVTLLRARDRQAFLKLLAELQIPYSPYHPARGVFLGLRDDGNPRLKLPAADGKVSLRGACLIGASEAELTVYVFHRVKNEARFRRIVQYVMRMSGGG